jgi:hypothetical protein
MLETAQIICFILYVGTSGGLTVLNLQEGGGGISKLIERQLASQEGDICIVYTGYSCDNWSKC